MAKVILITGVSSGLGEALANYFSAKGHTVYGASRRPVSGQHFRHLVMDVGRQESVQQGVAKVLQEEGRIDVLINNAGLGIAGPLEYLTEGDIRAVLDTNIIGVMNTCQAVLPAMRQQGSGLIINISSIGAEIGLPFRGLYSASKAAVDRLTESIRMEMAAYGVKACVVQPGDIRTAINQHRLATGVDAGSVYHKSFARTNELINEGVSKGMDPVEVCRLVDKVLQTPSPKAIYRIGKPLEKLSVTLKRILPSAVFEKMVRKHYE
ncbi:SDR family oxidoreductase [Flavihumibacter rivuli]|uniref:SDR family oxidoreductase n=1 Tax=Flavihumibacter rivuli TaxID=2838156 RepID=UPI001BDF3780|nr:SDR family oxidoreductase [Flavihumibacter rivuli]ULQ56805.1 SDR family oxidoreductase [Flavihumibacter rivuli]